MSKVKDPTASKEGDKKQNEFNSPTYKILITKINQ